MSRGKISDRQKDILEFIKKQILEKGYPPSVREIAEAVGLKSTSSVHAHLETLERNGYIRRDSTKSRTIEILEDDYGLIKREMAQIPIVGQVAAGQPILAEQNIEGYFPFPADMLPRGMGASEAFVLRVRGDSMINAGIMDGDSVFVRQSDTARNGDHVVALIDDSATVKTFYREAGYIRLQPENDSMEPIIVNDCKILGIVFGVFRLY